MTASARLAPISAVDLSTPGALDRLFAALGARFGGASMSVAADAAPVTGADGEPGEGEPPAGDGQEAGFPANTPLSVMTVEQQLAYWQAQSRKHEGRVKSRGDYDELAAKAKAYDEQVAAGATETEKAVAAALAQGRSDALGEANTKVSTAMVRAGLAARGISGQDADEVLAAVNPGAFVVDGDVDTDAVAAWVQRIGGPAAPPKVVDLGQGVRTTTRTSGVAAGRAAYEESRPKKA